MEDSIKIAHLIAKKYTDGLSEDENATLENWLKNPINLDLFNQISNKHLLDDRINAYKSINTEKAKEKYLKRISPRVNWIKRFSKVAAILGLLIAVGSAIYVIRDMVNENNRRTVVEKLEPGSSKAQLILADGSTIDLENSKRDLHLQDGITVVNNNGEISYDKQNIAIKEVKLNSLYVPQGGEYKLTLPDGTQVWLNSETKLTYPVQFIENNRIVKLEGEAYFEVTHNAEQPFIVETAEQNIEVLGTEFNISAYSDEENTVTTLVNGSVRGRYFSMNNTEEKITLEPNQQLVLNHNEKEAKLKQVDTYLYSAWKEGRFVFRNEELEDILQDMERWYGFDTEFESESLKHHNFSIDIKRYDSFTKVIQLLELTGTVDFQLEGSKLIAKSTS